MTKKNSGKNDNQQQETQEIEYKIITMKIGNITTGLKFILSITDDKKKQINMTPFQIKPETEYYRYNHHFDLREGKGDIEKLNKRFPSIFIPYSILKETETYKGITETSYTDLMRYYLYDLIKTGQMDIKGKNKNGDDIHLKLEWNGKEIKQPSIKKEIEKKKDKKEKLEDILEGLDLE